MNFETIWLSLCKKSPTLLIDETVVEFRAINLKSLLRQVYEQGQKSVPQTSPKKDPITDMVDSIFGKR